MTAESKMAAAMTTLLDDAAAAGYEVTTYATGTITVLRQAGRMNKEEGLVIYADGGAFMPSLARAAVPAIRDPRGMRRILGI